MLQRRKSRLARRAIAILTFTPLLVFGAVAQAGKPSNKPPIILGTPVTSVAAGASYAFQPVASDPEGRRLSFKVTNLPAWATFSTSTGRLSGTPTKGGTYSSISISVSDGKLTASLAPFSIYVGGDTTTNRTPTINGSVVTSITAGTPYAFRPTASDADGDPLTYSISGKPSWATFDRSNGTLYGTPGAADVGTYSNIVISVSDGTVSNSMAAFALTVTPSETRSVTVKWLPPTENTDGTPITDLSGYKVFYGVASQQYSTSMYLAGASATSVVVEGLAPGTYYFSVKAVNNAGIASTYADEVVAVL
jgi:Putative Ig domain